MGSSAAHSVIVSIFATKSQLLMQLLAAIFPAKIAPSADNNAARFDRPNVQEQT
ncbi:hypothetical protein [Rhizobium sp. LjRoot30]|uniref:hypothetical protein n=1 Tax=Rhizobium sp. LjRoot30 TaxID=3342320 RepID=UPI003F503172